MQNEFQSSRKSSNLCVEQDNNAVVLTLQEEGWDVISGSVFKHTLEHT